MPLTEKGQKVLSHMKEQYGEKKGKSVFYASINSGRLSGMEAGAARHQGNMTARGKADHMRKQGWHKA